MRNERTYRWYIYVAVTLVAGWLLIYFGGAAYEKYFGSNVMATVVAPPYNCDTRPRVSVSINGTTKQMRLGRKACYEQRYTVGSVWPVKLHPVTRGIMDDTAVPEVYFLVLCGIVIYGGIKRKSYT
ncbi:hypothetical protein [uncultured Chitinophaga sp.]|uniref:hypothetical protein n=1 Tax=uncultured Chitinophaga sp. TaxID=339340 RepID=UPI0025D3B45F|nr:hypothetical protein [uncultured Chitinophaga sp.]